MWLLDSNKLKYKHTLHICKLLTSSDNTIQHNYKKTVLKWLFLYGCELKFIRNEDFKCTNV